jgi:hypothetical protein
VNGGIEMNEKQGNKLDVHVSVHRNINLKEKNQQDATSVS